MSQLRYFSISLLEQNLNVYKRALNPAGDYTIKGATVGGSPVLAT